MEIPSNSKMKLAPVMRQRESADDEEEMEPLSPGHTRPLELDGSGYPPSYPTDKKGKGNDKNVKGKSPCSAVQSRHSRQQHKQCFCNTNSSNNTRRLGLCTRSR